MYIRHAYFVFRCGKFPHSFHRQSCPWIDHLLWSFNTLRLPWVIDTFALPMNTQNRFILCNMWFFLFFFYFRRPNLILKHSEESKPRRQHSNTTNQTVSRGKASSVMAFTSRPKAKVTLPFSFYRQPACDLIGNQNGVLALSERFFFLS